MEGLHGRVHRPDRAVVDGEAVRFSLGNIAPIIVWDRTPWYKDSAWLLPLIYLSMAVLFLTAIFWPGRTPIWAFGFTSS